MAGTTYAALRPVWRGRQGQRLLDGEVATAFLERVVALAQQRRLLSGEHFTVDGTLIEAWASVKSFTRKDGPPRPPDDPGKSRTSLLRRSAWASAWPWRPSS
jgi:hypothetical protein